ncbi:MAG: UDP-N-acetylglucosamine--N-acetylmuramyl-(pentapeptide) pyrophosphoryl-undecaprenol N-acetylglucosamine transferase [Alphaproteobacteria bacterium]
MTARLAVLAAGGTGGHLFPAEALAGALRARGWRVVLVADDATRATGGIETHGLGLRRMGAGRVSRLLGLASVAAAVPRAGMLLRRLQPAVAIGFGGYPSVPTLLAASRMGIPTLVHEQNAVLGRANRLLGRFVARIATSFPSTERMPARVPACLVGNPVRDAIRALHGAPYDAAPRDGRFRLLVLGGSQGARVFSDLVPAAAAALPGDLRARIAITQQARSEDVDRAHAAYLAAGVEAEVAPFFADVGQRMAGSQLVACRSGASTCAELACIGRPALLVPFPHAMDDHQAANARARGAQSVLARDPCAARVPERARIAEWMADPAPLAAAAAAMAAAGRPDAAERLADEVDALAATRGAGQEKAA